MLTNTALIFIFIYVAFFLFYSKKRFSSILVQILILIFCFIHIVLIVSGITEPFHYADSTYFYQGGKYLASHESGFNTIVKDLISYTHEVKYYGFFVLNYIFIYGSKSDISASISIAVCQSVIFLVFILWFAKNITDKLWILLILSFSFLFFITQNYRDGIVSIILVLTFYSLHKRSFILLGLSTILLVYFRYEFVYIIYLSLFACFVISKFKYSNHLLLLVLCGISLLIPLLVHHQRMDFFNIIKLPLAFIGKPIPQVIAEKIADISYYQNYFMSYLGFILSTFSMMVMSIFMLDYFLSKSMTVKYWNIVVLNTLMMSYFISMFLYTFINDGFSLRVKLTFLPCLFLLLSLTSANISIKKVLGRKKTILIYVSLYFFVLIVNIRWAF